MKLLLGRIWHMLPLEPWGEVLTGAKEVNKLAE